MGYWYFLYESVRILIVWVNCIHVTNQLGRWGGDLWTCSVGKSRNIQKFRNGIFGVMGSLHHYWCHYSTLNSNYRYLGVTAHSEPFFWSISPALKEYPYASWKPEQCVRIRKVGWNVMWLFWFSHIHSDINNWSYHRITLFKMRKNMSSKMRTALVYIALICFYLNLLIFELAHSHMSFHKCCNLALSLLAYNDILVCGQHKYLFSVYQYRLDL